MSAEGTQNTALRYAALGATVLAFVVVPWLLWGDWIEAQVEAAMRAPELTPALAVSIALLLALDVLLPIPSSFVAVAAGVFLGFGLGSLTVLVGLTIGSVVGYIVGARVGRVVAQRMVGEDAWRQTEHWAALHGSSLVLALRPVPVLAEASTFFAGATRSNWRPYMVYSTFGNCAVALVYAGVGDASADTGNLEVALMTGCVLPGLAIVFAGIVRGKRR